MEAISTELKLVDGMTPALRGMLKTMNMVCYSFESIRQLSVNAFEASQIQAVRQRYVGISAAVDEIGYGMQQARDEQEQFNQQINQGKSGVGGLVKKVAGLAKEYISMQTVKDTLAMSDNVRNTTARLSMVADVAPGQDVGQAVGKLQEKIFSAANRSGTNYMDMSDSVAQLSLGAPEAFATNDEAIQFVENLNKQFSIAGTDASGVEAVTAQMTESLNSGVMSGEAFNSVFKAAPNIIQTVADYLGVSDDEIQRMASEGELSAGIIKNAMLSATDSINAQYQAMPTTFSQLWNVVQNHAIQALLPVWEKLQEIASGQEFMSFAVNVGNALRVAAGIIAFILDLAAKAGSLITNNWSIIEPVIYGVIAALLTYYGAQLAVHAVNLIGNLIHIGMAAAQMMQAAATGSLTAATAAEIAAQNGLNTAMSACPIVWILIIIIAVIAAIYGIVAAINKLTGSTYSATGIIVGAISVAVAAIWNIVLGLFEIVLGIINAITNVFVGLGNCMANVFQDPIGSIIHLFGKLADIVLGLLEKIASGIDMVFGSNLADTVAGWRSSLNEKIEVTAEKYGNGKYEEVIAEAGLSVEGFGLERMEYGKTWDKAYEFGQGIDDKFSEFSMDNLLGGVQNPSSEYEDLANNVSNIANDTGNISNSLEIADEDIKYLREIGERDAINRFTTAEIRVDMGGVNNNINSSGDLDGIMHDFCMMLGEASEIAAEGGR